MGRDRMKDVEGNPEGIIAQVRDITQQKSTDEINRSVKEEHEERRMLSIRSDRLHSLGEMVTGITHELNQPLVGVRGLAEHMLLSIDRGWELSNDKIRERCQLIIEQADRMVHIIEHIRMFARDSGRSELGIVDVNQVITSSISMFTMQLRSHGVSLKYDLADELPMVLANPFSFEEVLINLLINARDALDAKIKKVPTLKPFIFIRTFITYIEDKGYVRMELTDNGIGIPDNLTEQIFKPFFTTKGPGKGTGLGLNISMSIIESFGGTIQVNSIFGEGTTLIVLIPIAEQSQKLRRE
jgi:histidine kinase